MNIIEKKENETIVCKIEGEININTSPELRKAFDGYIRDNIKKIVIDFTNVSYIDSSGLATLIELLQRLSKINGKFHICNISEKIKTIFEVTKLSNLFNIFDTCEAALKGF